MKGSSRDNEMKGSSIDNEMKGSEIMVFYIII